MPVEVVCPHVYAGTLRCGAAAGEPCVWVGLERGLGVDEAGRARFHVERVEAAAARGEVLVPSAELVDGVVDGLGLD